MKPLTSRTSELGFTLIEVIMVIVITGILAGIVAVFLIQPFKGYTDSVSRAELTDQADVALRYMARDIRLALPNSLRVMSSGNAYYIEFIPTSTGARYRDDSDGSTAGNYLSFTDTTDVTFDVLGTMPSNPTINVGDYIVIDNLGTGYAPADAYSSTAGQMNRATVSSLSGNVVTLASNPFAAQIPPLRSPNSRFQVVPGGVQAVTYSCPVSSAAAGLLQRYSNYGFNATQSVPSGSKMATARLVSGATCVVEYTQNATGRNGLLFIGLTLTSATNGESVTLFQQIHVDNTP